MRKDRTKAEYFAFLVSEGLVWAIKLYQAVLSPVFGGQCRFVPSCSNYAIESVRLFGPVRGVFLAVKRLLRCHPFGPQGYDPPPSPRDYGGQAIKEL